KKARRSDGMNNKFEIRGDVTAIFLKRRDGTILETLIDTVDLPKAQEFPNLWYAVWREDTQSFCVHGNIRRGGGKRDTHLLHRWITGAKKGQVVDHINHDTLDNRRVNLRVVTDLENQQNRIKPQRNNTSGIPGVTWAKHKQKWKAQIQIYGRNKHLGYFDKKEDAAIAAIMARLKYHAIPEQNKKYLFAFIKDAAVV
ncbi:MAG TPA: HNH endonuclease, partial [Fervidobacterium sp.]|nr:HNH endonuclease [Fervidobacterium sp.]